MVLTTVPVTGISEYLQKAQIISLIREKDVAIITTMDDMHWLSEQDETWMPRRYAPPCIENSSQAQEVTYTQADCLSDTNDFSDQSSLPR